MSKTDNGGSDVARRREPASAGRLRREDVAEGLRRVGIRRGDLLHFQVCTDGFGGCQGELDAQHACVELLEAIREVIGPEGTLVVPTYTFSLCRQQVYDVAETPTVPGPWNTFAEFPEYVRRLPGAVRSADPIFSTAALGPAAAELLRDLPRECLGVDCVHDRLRQKGGKLCLFGVGLHEAILRHHVEATVGVPWRYDKLFIGTVREGGTERREGWVYNVRILASNGDPAAAELEAAADATGIARSVRLPTGRLVAVEAAAFFELAADALRRDPWCTAKGPPGDPVGLEAARIAAPPVDVVLRANAAMQEMIDALWRLPRHIMSDAYDAALRALSTQVPMTIHEYPTGMPAWTWLVPEKWTCPTARLETVDGRRLFGIEDHPLHVVSYSLPFEGTVSREELLRHLHVHPRLPHAVPFIFKYYDRDWGLCCSRDQREALQDSHYRVVIRSAFSYGTLKVGEVVVPGASDECFVLCAHLCHPGMVNDDLSGVVVGVDVVRELLRRRALRYTYRLLLVPETIGSIAFLSQHESLIPRMTGGIFLEMLGMEQPHALQESFRRESEVDRCCKLALHEHDPGGWVGAFRSVIGNDERQFNAPGVRVPMLSLSRVLPPSAPDFPYREYHSSDDTPAAASPARLQESRDLVLHMIDTLEQNRVPVNRFKGEVFLARFGLFVDWYSNPAGHRAMMDVLYLIDGTRTIAEIASVAGLSFGATRETVERLRYHQLIEYADAIDRPGRRSGR